MNNGKFNVTPPKKIVVTGAGIGTSTLLRGPKQHDTGLSVIATMLGSGGSSGSLRRKSSATRPSATCVSAFWHSAPIHRRIELFERHSVPDLVTRPA